MGVVKAFSTAWHRDKAYGCLPDSSFSRPQAIPLHHVADLYCIPHSARASPAARLLTSLHAEAKIPSRYPASTCGRVPFSLHWASSEHQPECHSLQKAQPGCFSVTNHSTEPALHSLTFYFLCHLIFIIVLKPESSSHNVHGVLKARILKRFAIPISRGPCFVRTLYHDLSILGGPTWHCS